MCELDVWQRPATQPMVAGVYGGPRRMVVDSGPHGGFKYTAVLLVLLGWAVAAQARFVPPTCKNSFTTSQEIAYGDKARAQIFQQMPVLPDSSPITQYVQGLGARLVANAPGYRWPFNFHVVDSADINAFALPGGSIFINLGTIQAADTEAQLAGVMAHEISHVVLRHSTCNITKQKTKGFEYGLASLASAVLLGNTGLGGLAETGISAIQGLDYLHMSRDDEKQADLLGTDILYDTGYDPRALPQFFEIIESKYGKGGAQMLSDHPNPGNRVDYVNAEIATLPRNPHPIETSAAFTRIHRVAMGTRAYTAKEISSGSWKKGGPPTAGPVADMVGKSGVSATGASQPVAAVGQGIAVRAAALSQSVYLPQGAWRQFNGTGYTESYPGNWQVSQGSQASVTIAPQGGVVGLSGGDSAVSYGVIVDAATVPSTGGQLSTKDFDAATQKLVASLEQGSNGLKPLGTMTNVSVNGQSGRSQEFRGMSPVNGSNGAPLREHDWLVTIWRPDGDMNYLVFVAPEQNFMALRPVFEKMLREFKVR